MFNPNIIEIQKVMQSKGYAVFHGVNSINIVGIRTPGSDNKFTDTMCVFWTNDRGRRLIEYFPCTTKPGKHWLLNPLNKKGTAILLPNQYRKIFKIGIHNRSRPTRSYTALEQVGKMQYIRDNTKDSKHDYTGKNVTKSFWYNIKSNIHRAGKSGWSRFVDRWSAACQVITGKYSDTQTNWEKFWDICTMSSRKYGDYFTYTLLEQNDFT